MNDDSLRRLLRNSLQERRAPVGLCSRILGRLVAAPRRPRALTLFAVAAIFTAAGLRLASRHAEETPAPVAALPAWIIAAMEQHGGTSDMFSRTPPMASRELTEKVLEQSGCFVDLPGLREAGYEPREVHRCIEKGFAHVIYANSWSKLSCFLFEESLAPFTGGQPLEGGVGTLYTSGEASAVAVKDGSLVKVWVSELRPAQLTVIALNAEHKKDRMKTTRLAGMKGPASRAAETVLLGIPGVEDVTFGPDRREAFVQFDERQVSEDAIGAVATMNGVAEGWGAEGR